MAGHWSYSRAGTGTPHKEIAAAAPRTYQAIKAKRAENLMERGYRHLSNAADRGDEAANTIHSIVVKRGGS